MSVRKWIRETLDEAGVPFQASRHPAVFTSQDLAQEEHTPGRNVAKTVVLMARGTPVLLVMPAHHKVVMHRAKEMLEADFVRMASENEIREHFRGCEVGAIPPLPHWKDIEIWMDPAMRSGDTILFPAGNHTDAVRMSFNEWHRLVNPKEAYFSEEATTVDRLKEQEEEEEDYLWGD